jgi:hypothetical protein
MWCWFQSACSQRKVEHREREGSYDMFGRATEPLQPSGRIYNLLIATPNQMTVTTLVEAESRMSQTRDAARAICLMSIWVVCQGRGW